jgi:23S rRNA pseudouridine1911/1915/1917 synthase
LSENQGAETCDAPGWLPESLNGGWTYRDRVAANSAGLSVAGFYASHHRHSTPATWQARLAAGEIELNGKRLLVDRPLAAGDRLAWHRPPWREEAVPSRWSVVHDDGDLLVIDKPAGLPVLPAGGWLEHTVLRLLERRHLGDPAGIPRPVHRLGRFTSGLLVCARTRRSRAWLSAALRESTASCQRAPWGSEGPPPPDRHGCRKTYRALLVPGRLDLQPGQASWIEAPIGRRPHQRLGRIWCAADGSFPDDLVARSQLTLLERRPQADLAEVVIRTGRPHQVRIHCAVLGAPLRDDPLYLPGGLAAETALPGQGGYRLRSCRIALEGPDGFPLSLEAPAVAWC